MKKLLYNAVFHSMRTEGESFGAVLLEGDTIREVFRCGCEPTGAGIERVDLGGRTVFPGFIDTHTHAFEGGLYTLGADLSGARTLDEVFSLLREARPVNGKIFGWRFDENAVAEVRFPTLSELDRVHPSLPVFLRRVDGHSCTINSAALREIFPPARSSAGGLVPSAEELEAGRPLSAALNSEVSKWFHKDLGEEGVYRAYEAASRLALKYGVTTVHAMVDDEKGMVGHFEYLRDHIRFPGTEFVLYPQTFDIDRTVSLGSKRIGGCLLVDGSFGSGTAALTEPYLSRPGCTGILYRSDGFWERFVRESVSAGLSVAVHAIGDAAIDQILRAYEKEGGSPELPHQIIHSELASDPMIARMKALGVSAVMQPAFDALWGGTDGMYARLLGVPRALGTNRLGTLVSNGILVTGGSDWYITPLDAPAGMHAASHLHNERERLSPFQAAELYTSAAARVSGDGRRLGSILPGYQADLVVLDSDPLADGAFETVRIHSVMKRGVFVANGPGR